jgi:hypothetical protein
MSGCFAPPHSHKSKSDTWTCHCTVSFAGGSLQLHTLPLGTLCEDVSAAAGFTEGWLGCCPLCSTASAAARGSALFKATTRYVPGALELPRCRPVQRGAAAVAWQTFNYIHTGITGPCRCWQTACLVLHGVLVSLTLRAALGLCCCCWCLHAPQAGSFRSGFCCR